MSHSCAVALEAHDVAGSHQHPGPENSRPMPRASGTIVQVSTGSIPVVMPTSVHSLVRLRVRGWVLPLTGTKSEAKSMSRRVINYSVVCCQDLNFILAGTVLASGCPPVCDLSVGGCTWIPSDRFRPSVLSPSEDLLLVHFNDGAGGPGTGVGVAAKIARRSAMIPGATAARSSRALRRAGKLNPANGPAPSNFASAGCFARIASSLGSMFILSINALAKS